MLMLDSGAFSIWKEFHNKGKKLKGDALWQYVDDYAKFIKQHNKEITTYVNVDIPFSPEITWEVQKYMENTHKLNPLPVYHPNEDIKWLKKYIDNYDYIGIGVMGASTVGKQTWIKNTGDRAFSLICDTPNRLPRVKTHAFAAASPELFVKYPWYSIDSASWVIYGKYGGIIVPRKKNGKYDYALPPYLIKTSWRNWHINKPGTHIDNVTEIQKKALLEYLEMRGVTLGISEYRQVEKNYTPKEYEFWLDKEKGIIEVVIEYGVCNDYRKRDDVNLYYFLDMERNAPEYPWAWSIKTRRLF